MGYGTENVPLDFSKRDFGLDNGSRGKMPTLLDEWRSVGIRELDSITNEIDGSSEINSILLIMNGVRSYE